MRPRIGRQSISYFARNACLEWSGARENIECQERQGQIGASLRPRFARRVLYEGGNIRRMKIAAKIVAPYRRPARYARPHLRLMPVNISFPALIERTGQQSARRSAAHQAGFPQRRIPTCRKPRHRRLRMSCNQAALESDRIAFRPGGLFIRGLELGSRAH